MRQAVSDSEVEETKLPRPFPGGTYAIQSNGTVLDRLMGDRKARAIAREQLEPFLMSEDEPTADPEPTNIPEPVPGGTETITKGDDPPGEQR